MIDIVGHFGTMHSYASVAGRVAEALKHEGLLGRVVNLDPALHDRWRSVAEDPRDGTHVLVIAVPHHYLSSFSEQRGSDRSAIFISPNTTEMDREYLTTISKFGTVIAPSRFCLKALDDVPDRDFVASVLPLGCPVHDSVLRGRRAAGFHGSTMLTAVHFTSDFAWPGRKGTEELIDAWAMVRPRAKLIIHGPSALQKAILYKIADYDLSDDVVFRCGEARGESDASLSQLYEEADLVIAPSRCEGYGMMISGALVAGVPLLTTCNTGHAEFLVDWPGRWMCIPSPFEAPLSYENGLAPAIDVGLLGASLERVFDRSNIHAMQVRNSMDFEKQGNWGTWEWALPQWIEKLRTWVEGG